MSRIDIAGTRFKQAAARMARSRTGLPLGIGLALAGLLVLWSGAAQASTPITAGFEDFGSPAVAGGHGAFAIASTSSDSLYSRAREHSLDKSELGVDTAASLLAKRPIRNHWLIPVRSLDPLRRPVLFGRGRIVGEVRGVNRVWPFNLRQ